MNLRNSLLTIVLAVTLFATQARAGEACESWKGGPLVFQPQGINGVVLTSINWNSWLVVGGNFTTAGGTTVNNIAAWDGASWRALGSGTNGTVYALGEYNGELIVGGTFTTINGQAIPRIARYNGQNWQALGLGVGNSAQDRCRSLTVYNGDLIAGGKFTVAGGVAASNIAKWNGTTWSGMSGGVHSPNPISDEVRALRVHNNILFVGGWFSNAGPSGSPVAVSNVAQYLAQTQTWHAMTTGTSDFVNAFNTWNGDLVVGGSFSSAGGVAGTVHVARWTSAATWGAIGGGVGGSAVYSFQPFNGQLVAGIETFGTGLLGWNGSAWVNVGTGVAGGAPNSVYTLNVFNTELIAGGSFSSAGGNAATNVARWNASTWRALDNFYPAVAAYALVGSRIVAGGNFKQSTSSSANANNLIAFDGVNKTRLAAGVGGGEGTNGLVRALKSFSTAGPLGSRFLVVGGDFTFAGGVSANRIAMYTEPALSPATWSAMGGGFTGSVQAIERFNSATYAGGIFASPTSRIARWDGSAWQPLGTGMNGSVHALKAYNGFLYAGGEFTTAGGVSTGGLARWNGTTWSNVGGFFLGTVFALEVHNNELVIGGQFPGLAGSPNIAKYNGTSYSNLGTGGTNGTVNALHSAGGYVYVTGGFDMAGGVSAPRIARWSAGTGWTGVSGGIPNAGEAPQALASFNGEIHAGLGTVILLGGDDGDGDGKGEAIGGGAPNPGNGWLRYSPDGVPWIVVHPISQTVACDADVSFSVQAATGYTVNHAWRRNGTPLVDGPTMNGSAIVGANSATLMVINAQAADAGSYDCVVSNSCGGNTSFAAMLTVQTCCDADVTNDGVVNIDDLLTIINTWGAIGPNPADANHDGVVNIDDLLIVINGWGACP